MKINIFANKKIGVVIISLIFLTSLILFINPDFLLEVLPSCVLNTVFGIKCPFCGMTQDIVLIVKGYQPVHNPFSPAMVVIAFLVYPLVLILRYFFKIEIKISYNLAKIVLLLTMLIMVVFNNIKCSN